MLSTGGVHPLAIGHSGCFKMWEGNPSLSFDVFGLCVCGDYIASGTWTFFISIWNWKTGALVSYQVREHVILGPPISTLPCPFIFRRFPMFSSRRSTFSMDITFYMQTPQRTAYTYTICAAGPSKPQRRKQDTGASSWTYPPSTALRHHDTFRSGAMRCPCACKSRRNTDSTRKMDVAVVHRHRSHPSMPTRELALSCCASSQARSTSGKRSTNCTFPLRRCLSTSQRCATLARTRCCRGLRGARIRPRLRRAGYRTSRRRA